MSIFRLILRELLFRRLNFLLGVVSVSAAVACAVGTLTMLRAHDAETERIVAAKETETRERMAKLEDDYRKITKGLGFNVLILPRTQSLSDLYAQDFATNTMPEAYVERLAKSRVATIQHLLPSLQQKLKWPETERTIILIGVRGEVPILNANAKKPIQDAVAPGSMTLGWELHRSLQLQKGAQIKLLGRQFTVGQLQQERGTKDDITVWINLKEAQELLGKNGLINGILALECVCAADSLAKVRAEIESVLPDTQVIEFQSQTLARAEARQRAAAEARASVEQEKQNRSRLRTTRETFAARLVPGVALGAALWVALLSLSNVRERRAEIGLLRAMGVSSRQVLLVFLGRAVLMGVLGAGVGYFIGLLAGGHWSHGPGAGQGTAILFDPALTLAVLGGTPLLAALAGWLPALLAAQQDPAQALRQE